jgi:hypothetical protein
LLGKNIVNDDLSQNDFLDGVSQIDGNFMIQENLNSIEAKKPPVPEFDEVLIAQPPPMAKPKTRKSKSKNKPKVAKPQEIEVIEIDDSESDKAVQPAKEVVLQSDKFGELDAILADTFNLINGCDDENEDVNDSQIASKAFIASPTSSISKSISKLPV